jgi:hypothetical protein
MRSPPRHGATRQKRDDFSEGRRSPKIVVRKTVEGSKQMSAKHIVDQLGITIGEKSVELQLGESVFKLGLDEYGFPDFPESVKNELPPYVPEMVEKMMCKMRSHGPNQAEIYLDVGHKVWCAELTGIGMCNCNPFLRDAEIREYSGTWQDRKLTCVLCDESSTGEIHGRVLQDDGDELWERFWTNGGDRFYWIFSGDESRLLICEDCLSNFMAKYGVKFPNIIDEDSSTDSKH